MSQPEPAPLTIRCIAVDDEPLALGLVCSFIQQTPFLELVGRYESAVAALRALHEHPEVQLLFLDIKMPDLSGLELARVIQSGQQRVIFTTAFNQYALEGFRVDALDYLLKPFNYEEFLRSALKAKAFFELKQAGNTPASAVPQPTPAPAEPAEDHLYLKVEYQLVRVAFNDILYVEGLKDYVKVHLASQQRPLLSLTSLRNMEEKLPGRHFMRIHRSYIIGLDHIQAIGRGTVQIKGETIPVSDGYREVFDQFFSKWK